ncbi:centromere protein J [Zeugodacus cucurbitae]|uniref:centromere protein J n=1 Tax=Zeugodacus cucurbitae TaxID=28588 RepID=UPI0023D96017|nr:centromere protein J [Zeugodacus cucurbitae]
MLKMLRTNCNNSSLDAQVNIVKRLEKLNKWQEEQKRLLDERQNMQRKMLGLEHQDVYEKLGFISDNDIIANVENGGGDTSVDQIKIYGDENNFGSDSKINEIENRLFQGINKNQEEFSNPRNYNNIAYNNEELEVIDAKPKRPYLKRGEGIKARYKISPESLRLNNLPRYKYAATHSKIKNMQRRRLAPRVKPSQKNLVSVANTEDYIDDIKQDVNEKQFHKMLATANPANSSTPDSKYSKAPSSSISITLPNVRLRKTEYKETKVCEDFEESGPEEQVEPYVSITWSKVLDPQHIKPIPIEDLRTNVSISERNTNTNEDDETLSIFELLERQADQGAIDMNSSCVKKFLNNKIKNDKNDSNETEMLIKKRYADCRLRPTVEEMLRCDSDEENSSSDSTDLRGEERRTPGILTYLSAECKNESTLNGDKMDLHVRFSEENTTCEYEQCEDIISNNSMIDEATTTNKSSYLFHQFKDALFSALLGKDAGEDKATGQKMLMSSPPSALTQELQEKSNIIKLRLEELEKEIAAFRNNNIELLRAKQEYEMERAHFSQERNEALDRLKDDKIQMEMYLHDERMKIEEERRKFEHQMRVQKQVITSKERKEIARLKDELEALQIQLKQKEQLHASAQARLRVQIRNMERDQKQLYEDIERLTKENKRLQNEKQKLEREGNNKMLMEINRNIAKLAPKLTNGNTSNNSEYPDLNNRSCTKNSKPLHTSPTQKSNGKFHRITKAPPNTRNTSRTDLINDSEKSCALYKLDIDERCNDSEGDLADDDDDIISELKQTQNCKSVKSVESTSRSNTSKDTVIYKGNDRPSVKDHVVDMEREASGHKSGKSGSEREENFRREIINPDGSKDILYPNGNLKKISSDGMNIRMLYFNKDIKETNVNEGTVKYYYAETNTWHTTYLDGLEILEFPNGQTEHRYKNGVVEIHLPDNSVKITNPAEKEKLEEWRFADGTNLIQMRNGDRVLMLPNGQKEIHTKLNKRREYPDGTVKLVYPDGSQETRYSNGRVRLKDKDGILVMDTERI